MDEAEQRRRRNRARARLRALGIDVDTMDTEQVRHIWETTRAAYIDQANAGTHLNPIRLENDPMPGACLHARFGAYRDALSDWYGQHPADWSPAQIAWPTHQEHAAGKSG